MAQSEEDDDMVSNPNYLDGSDRSDGDDDSYGDGSDDNGADDYEDDESEGRDYGDDGEGDDGDEEYYQGSRSQSQYDDDDNDDDGSHVEIEDDGHDYDDDVEENYDESERRRGRDDDDHYEDDEGSRSRSQRSGDYEEDEHYDNQSPSRSQNGTTSARRSDSDMGSPGQQRQYHSPQSPIQDHARQLRQEMVAAMEKAPQIRPVRLDDGGGGDDDGGGGGRHKQKESRSDIRSREVREILQAANERIKSISPTRVEKPPPPAPERLRESNNRRKGESSPPNGVQAKSKDIGDERSKSKNIGDETSYHFSSQSPRSSEADTAAARSPKAQDQPKTKLTSSPRPAGNDSVNQLPKVPSPTASPKREKGNNTSANSSGETTLDNTGHMSVQEEEGNIVSNLQSKASSSPPPASKKDQIPKGSTGSHNGQRTGKSVGGSSSHHRRRQHQVMSGARISWKSDPDASFSDWTIRVYHDEGGGGMDKYFIHRNICGFGTRKSEYLLRAFRGDENEMTRQGVKSDWNNRTTLLDLPSSQARVFPMVLDFMYYTKEAKSTLTATRACEVFMVAGLLEIPMLQKAISDFYLKNLNIKNMGEFLTAANKSKAETLLVVCKSKIGKMITEKPQLAGLVPPKYLADILLISRKQLDDARAQYPERYPESLVVSQSRYWSKAACICAVHNESILTKNLFELLTGEDALPYIDASVAQQLLVLDKKFNHVGSTPDEYTSLQMRCIASIADDFHTFQRGFQSEDAAVDSLKEWPSHILADILVKTMKKK